MLLHTLHILKYQRITSGKTLVSSAFHSAVVEACQPEMLVIRSEITDTQFRLEIQAYGAQQQPLNT